MPSPFWVKGAILKNYEVSIPLEEYMVEEWLQSNICRCTSYEEIRHVIKAVLSPSQSRG